MKWSHKLGRFAGIDVYVHSTFYLLIGWVLFSYWHTSNSVRATLAGLVFILLIFLCVVLHEYGHALTARTFQIPTKDITLLPIGGVARLEKMPDDPVQELWVALAGPAVNLVIALGLGAYLYVTRSFVPLENLGVASGSMVERLLIVNVFLVGFNLLPAFPMDGGRVLRALLATRIDYVRATRIAAKIGQGMALLFGFMGLYNPLLIFIAFFVWIGASQEARMVEYRRALSGIPISQVMMHQFKSLAPTDSVSRARELVLSGTQRSIPVIEDGSLVGVVSFQDLVRATAQKLEEEPIREIMTSQVQTVSPEELLTDVLPVFQEKGQEVIPVLDNGKLIGLVNGESIQTFFLFRSGTPRPTRKPS